jgi:anti-sigma B factor antagonist
MAMRPFQVKEEDIDPDGRSLAVEGELDLAVAEHLQEAIDRATADGKQVLLVDLGACEFIDSTGIAVLMRAQAADSERKMAVFGACGSVGRVFSVTGLDTHEHFVNNRDEALALLSHPEPA